MAARHPSSARCFCRRSTAFAPGIPTRSWSPIYFRSARTAGSASPMFCMRDSLRVRRNDLNAKLVAIAKLHPNLLLLDLDLLFRRHGEDVLISNAFWYTARIRYTARMFELLAETVRQAVDAHAQRSKKVLVLDLDDTLWGGIVGETRSARRSAIGGRQRPLLPRFSALHQGRNSNRRPARNRQQEQRSRCRWRSLTGTR